MTAKQRDALSLLRRSHEACTSTDDGITTSVATYYDVEIDVAAIHFQTARALRAQGLVEFGDWDPDWGTQLHLTEKALPSAAVPESSDDGR